MNSRRTSSPPERAVQRPRPVAPAAAATAPPPSGVPSSSSSVQEKHHVTTTTTAPLVVQPAPLGQNDGRAPGVKYTKAVVVHERGHQRVQIEVELFPHGHKCSEVGVHYTVDGWQTVQKAVGFAVGAYKYVVEVLLASSSSPSSSSSSSPVVHPRQLWFAVYARYDAVGSVWDNNNGWNYQVLETSPVEQKA